MLKTALEILKHVGNGVKNAALAIASAICFPFIVLFFLWADKFHPEWFDDFD